MSRHRNVRTMNFEDEYFDEDEVYGHSYDDSYCVSPATAAQFTFNRERDVNLSSYMEEGIPEEEDESDPEPLSDSGRDNLKLDDVEQAKLNSCKEEIVNVIGDTIPEHIVSQAVVKHQYNIQAALNELLNQSEAPKPQRQPRPDRRANRQVCTCSAHCSIKNSSQEKYNLGLSPSYLCHLTNKTGNLKSDC